MLLFTASSARPVTQAPLHWLPAGFLRVLRGDALDQVVVGLLQGFGSGAGGGEVSGEGAGFGARGGGGFLCLGCPGVCGTSFVGHVRKRATSLAQKD
jgi:hypothetical protein